MSRRASNRKSPFELAQAALRELGLVIKRTDYGEYRVNYKGGDEGTAYYTDDLDDAVVTGQHMAKHASPQ